MNRRRALMLAGAALLASGAPRARSMPGGAPLELGVFPYLSPRALLATHQPIKSFVDRQLGRPVHLSTATNYESFNGRTLRGEYDLLITPPHFARLAQIEAGYVPLAAYSKPLRVVIAVGKASPVTDIRQLRGKTVVTPDRLAVVTLVAMRVLGENGLRADIDYTLRTSTSHASAAYAAANGEADAVVTELAAFQKGIPGEVRDALRVLTLVGNLPHVMYLGHPRVGADNLELLRTGLLDFARNSPEGKAFVESTGFEGLRAVTDADMKAMDPYVAELRSLIH
jgi:phosphonate transport system substrate-binding protein